MKYAIYCNSITGNTELLANQINIDGKCIYRGNQFDSRMLDAELIFIGFWTDKGSCHEQVKEALKQIKNKNIFLFGTAGFGGAKEYFDRILRNVQKSVDDSCTVVGTYMCQGKMPQSIRDRYQKMLESDPKNPQFINLIENFDKALTHPNKKDLETFKDMLKLLGK